MSTVGVNVNSDMNDDVCINALAIAAMARGLGWNRFTMFINNEPWGEDGSDEKKLIVWMKCRDQDTHSDDKDFFMQINLFNLNELNDNKFLMCVYAIRYHMCSGWRLFEVAETSEERQREVKRLSQFFDVSHFTSEENRELYKVKFPHATEYTWEKVLEEGVPELL